MIVDGFFRISDDTEDDSSQPVSENPTEKPGLP